MGSWKLLRRGDRSAHSSIGADGRRNVGRFAATGVADCDAGRGDSGIHGSRFRQIRASQQDARVVTALLPVSSGSLLIGTAKLGLLIYDGKALRKFHATTNDVYVTALAGSEAELWVGTVNDGLLYWHGGQTEHIGEAQGLPDRRVDQIALGVGRAYVGTPMGVAEVRDGKILRELAKGRYAHALLAEGDSLLVGQVDAGVMRVSLWQWRRWARKKADRRPRCHFR